MQVYPITSNVYSPQNVGKSLSYVATYIKDINFSLSGSEVKQIYGKLTELSEHIVANEHAPIYEIFEITQRYLSQGITNQNGEEEIRIVLHRFIKEYTKKPKFRIDKQQKQNKNNHPDHHFLIITRTYEAYLQLLTYCCEHQYETMGEVEEILETMQYLQKYSHVVEKTYRRVTMRLREIAIFPSRFSENVIAKMITIFSELLFRADEKIIDEIINDNENRNILYNMLIHLKVTRNRSLMKAVLEAFTNIAAGSDKQTMFVVNFEPFLQVVQYLLDTSTDDEVITLNYHILSNLSACIKDNIRENVFWSELDHLRKKDVLYVNSDVQRQQQSSLQSNTQKFHFLRLIQTHYLNSCSSVKIEMLFTFTNLIFDATEKDLLLLVQDFSFVVVYQAQYELNCRTLRCSDRTLLNNIEYCVKVFKPLISRFPFTFRQIEFLQTHPHLMALMELTLPDL